MSKQTSAKTSSAWRLHTVLTVVACVWLYVADHLDLPFIAVVAVTGFVVLLGGTITAVQTDKQRQAHRRDIRQLTQQCAAKSDALTELVKTLPALHVIFATLHPQRANGPMAIHYFAEWLAESINAKQSNVINFVRWVKTWSSHKQPDIKGLMQHIAPNQWNSAVQCIIDRARGALTESAIRQLSAKKASPPQPTDATQTRSKPSVSTAT